jgi:hypothetical protein
MTADQFLAALQAEGLEISERAGWRTHNRAGHGGWGPMNGVMIHHTAGVAPGDGSVVWSGRSDLPGPLAHGYLAKSGVVTMTANGRANHAGGGSPAVLAAVVTEKASYPTTRYHDGSSGAVDGNAHFYGLEISNLGTSKDSYPAAQYDAAVRWAAAICRHHGWSAKSVIGHKVWSDWKSDPSFDMNKFRADVAACLAAKAGAWGATKEDSMTISRADAQEIWDADVVDASRPPVANGDYAKNKKWRAWYALSTAAESARLAQAAAEKSAAQATLNAASIAVLADRLDNLSPEIDYAKLAAALVAAVKS